MLAVFTKLEKLLYICLGYLLLKTCLFIHIFKDNFELSTKNSDLYITILQLYNNYQDGKFKGLNKNIELLANLSYGSNSYPSSTVPSIAQYRQYSRNLVLCDIFGNISITLNNIQCRLSFIRLLV